MRVKKAYQLEKSDFTHFGFYAARRGALIEAVVAVIVAFAASYFILDRELFVMGSIISSAAVLCIILPVIYISSYRSSVKSYERYSRDFAMVETTVDKRGFTQQSAIGKTTVPFDKLYKVCESKYGIYVYVSSRQAIILSKKIFTAEESDTIKNLFRKNVAARRLHLYS